ncbi:MAG TPA: hypothetical protein PKO15_14170 [Fibrobacteria bacterium]|nr:hypothetical protein [Fibrobacteria bacterium]HOX52224.1 hypothetical protein [Fibrobacteria bacterium]
MNFLRTTCLAGIVLCTGCRPGSEEVSNQFELDAYEAARRLAEDVARYEPDCQASSPRSDGCQGLAQTLGLMGIQLVIAGQTDTAANAMIRAVRLMEAMDLDPRSDSVLARMEGELDLRVWRVVGMQGDAAENWLEKARVRAESLLEEHPGDTAVQRLAIEAWQEVGDLHARKASLDQAHLFHRRAALLLDSLASSSPLDSALANRRFGAWELAYKDLERIGRMEATLEVAQKALAAARTARAKDASTPPRSEPLENELAALNWVTLARASADAWNLADTEQREALELSRRLFEANPSDMRMRMLRADAWMRSADFDCHLGRNDQGAKAYLAVGNFVDSFPEDSWTARVRTNLYSDLVECSQDPAVKLDYARKAVQWAEVLAGTSSNVELVDALGTLSWYALLQRRYLLADSAASRAVELADRRGAPQTARWIELNLAHARMLTGRSDEAMAMYRRLAPMQAEDDASRTYAWYIRDDLAKLEQAGIHHPDFAKVRAILNKR